MAVEEVVLRINFPFSSYNRAYLIQTCNTRKATAYPVHGWHITNSMPD